MTATRRPLRLTYIGGPTALIELAGLRLLTDPTFDAAGAEFRSGAYALEKTEDPAIDAAQLGHIDAVLLSHDHHFDNLDEAGRRYLAMADRVITTMLEPSDQPGLLVYISGDTVWYEGVAEVARRFPATVAILFMGAARVEAVGPWNLTFTAQEAVEAAKALSRATIIPLHYEGWKHFSESRIEIERAFTDAGLARRVTWLERGAPTDVAVVA